MLAADSCSSKHDTCIQHKSSHVFAKANIEFIQQILTHRQRVDSSVIFKVDFNLLCVATKWLKCYYNNELSVRKPIKNSFRVYASTLGN